VTQSSTTVSDRAMMMMMMMISKVQLQLEVDLFSASVYNSFNNKVDRPQPQSIRCAELDDPSKFGISLFYL